MLLEVKRIAIDIGNQLMFEQVNQATRNRLVNSLTTVLASIQANQGIDMFSVIADETNNTPADEEANRINCRVKLVPVRAVEFIALDFIITNSGVMFV
jgi:phage tail sheath protein FI